MHDLIARRLLRIELPPGGTTFRLVRTDLARRIVDLQLGTPYFLATLPRLTSCWTTVPVGHRARLRGRPKVTVRGLARHAVELFMSYSVRPVTFAAQVCLAAAVVAAAAAPVALTPAGERAATALVGLALAGGLVGLAVIARYLVHIAHRERRLPQYLIREASVPVRAEEQL